MKIFTPSRAREFRPVRALVDLFADWIERFVAVQGVDRAMAIGAQAYTALFPLLIVYVSVSPLESGRSISELLIDACSSTAAPPTPCATRSPRSAM